MRSGSACLDRGLRRYARVVDVEAQCVCDWEDCSVGLLVLRQDCDSVFDRDLIRRTANMTWTVSVNSDLRMLDVKSRKARS